MNLRSEQLASEKRKSKTGGVVVPHRPRWYQQIVAWGVFALIRIVSSTLRIKWIDTSGHFDKGPAVPAIYCIWHNRLALCMTAYYGYVVKHSRSAGLAAMVSASKDGGFLAAILQCFNVEPVRGSTSRRGPQALLELTTCAERGLDLAITPDGPRGPRYQVQDGVMSLAQITGLAIVPVSYYVRWKFCVNSWDRFQIPLPFATCEMKFGPSIRVPREASDAEREQLRLGLEKTLRELSVD
ncbi:MAG TPA: lysophospholipid acyltransferase family protein [Verrucomicrobiae bacterium]|nr:lysophospholipid acyltransferase family protein [Verrucomicrobiae bacterium]